MPRQSPKGRIYRKDWLRSLRLSSYWMAVVEAALILWLREQRT